LIIKVKLFEYFIFYINLEPTDNSSSTTTVPPISKSTIIREPLKFQVELLDYLDPSSEAQMNSFKK
jgi:hypothetical protein